MGDAVNVILHVLAPLCLVRVGGGLELTLAGRDLQLLSRCALSTGSRCHARRRQYEPPGTPNFNQVGDGAYARTGATDGLAQARSRGS